MRQRAWYYTRIYADTKNHDAVYVVNVNYHKSVDGGKSFESNRAPHGDHHDLWLDPQNPKRMIIADDGGAQVSHDGGEFWTSYYNQPTAQFYRVSTDNHFPYRIYAAQQDNSTVRINSQSRGSSISRDDWESTAGGESAHIAIDPSNNDIVYGGSYGGFLTRKNHKTGSSRAINIWPDNPMGYGAEGMKYRFQWNFPIIYSRHFPNRLYAFSNHVHFTENEGQSWNTVSEDLTTNSAEKLVSSGGPITQDNTGVEYYCTIFAASESPRNSNIMWVGSDDGLVHLSTDATKNWTEVTPAGMPSNAQINSIESSWHDESTAFIAATAYKSGDYSPYLYKTTNKGQSWTKITNGIDNQHFTRVVRQDPINKNLLFAGTESGLYVSYDQGSYWSAFKQKLPIVPITDLTIKNNDLIVATQGRGLWSFDYLNILRTELAKTKDEELVIFRPNQVYRIGGRQSESPGTAGRNKYPGLEMHYYLKDYIPEDSLTIHVISSRDTIVFSTNSKDKKYLLEPNTGSNVLKWDLHYPAARKFDKMVLWWGNLNGPKAIPGEYRAEFYYKNIYKDVPFELIQNPTGEGSGLTP